MRIRIQWVCISALRKLCAQQLKGLLPPQSWLDGAATQPKLRPSSRTDGVFGKDRRSVSRISTFGMFRYSGMNEWASKWLNFSFLFKVEPRLRIEEIPVAQFAELRHVSLETAVDFGSSFTALQARDGIVVSQEPHDPVHVEAAGMELECGVQ